MLLSDIISSLAVGVVVVDESFCIRAWNSFMEKKTGLFFCDLDGGSVFDVCPSFMKKDLRCMLEVAFLKGTGCITDFNYREEWFKISAVEYK